jgi:steroid delta-isomerase-like uncharacterized protein
MPVKENIEFMRRWFQEVWNEGKTQTIHELFSPDGVATGHFGAQSQIRGPESFVPFVERIRGAFPDIKVTIDDAFGARDKVVLRWSASMTHTGNGLGPATGKPVRLTGITIVRIVKGKIVAGWDNWDQLGMLEQIGAYKRPEPVILEKSA